MSDPLFDDDGVAPKLGDGPTPNPARNLPEYSVGEISHALKRTLENAYERVRVRGEISKVTRHASGHIYFTLKDPDAVLDSVVWRSTVRRLRFLPEEGLEVLATGKITTWEKSSKYQLVVDQIEPAGAGALMVLLEQRRKKLAAEGLFDPARKKPLPYLPDVIGVVTSPTGAVIRDIRHRLADRFPRHVLVWPVKVQGDEAAAQIAAAIQGFNRLRPGGAIPRPDVLIVARGGGSIEDLWPFNEEIVVRAAAASAIPLISAVGHETDTTLIDFAADKRAPTPSAAAEMAVPVRRDLALKLDQHGGRLRVALVRRLDEGRTTLLAAVRGLRHPGELIERAVVRLGDLEDALGRALKIALERRWRTYGDVAARLRPQQLSREIADKSGELAKLAGRLAPALGRTFVQTERRLAAGARLLASLSYARVLERGYALVRDRASGKLLMRARATGDDGTELAIQFRDGLVPVTVGAAGARRKSKRDRSPGGSQGELL